MMDELHFCHCFGSHLHVDKFSNTFGFAISIEQLMIIKLRHMLSQHTKPVLTIK